MKLQSLAFAAALTVGVQAQNNADGPTDSPPGVPFPDTTYPNAISNDPVVVAGSKANQSSPDGYPSPWGEGVGDWADAYSKAKAFVSQLTLLEKVNLTTGVGWEGERCVGQNGAIPRLGFRSMCLQDSPVGVRDSETSPTLTLAQILTLNSRLCLGFPCWCQCGGDVVARPGSCSRSRNGLRASWKGQ